MPGFGWVVVIGDSDLSIEWYGFYRS
ncbi:unnamed protein product, partial [Rotaria sp. Silwood1]